MIFGGALNTTNATFCCLELVSLSVKEGVQCTIQVRQGRHQKLEFVQIKIPLDPFNLNPQDMVGSIFVSNAVDFTGEGSLS